MNYIKFAIIIFCLKAWPMTNDHLTTGFLFLLLLSYQKSAVPI